MPDVLGLSSEGDVVVDELAPGNEEDCHCVVVETLVLMILVILIILMMLQLPHKKGPG